MRILKPGAAAVEVRQSVCSATDPADSIGKLLKDYLDAAVSSRAAAATYTAARAALLDYLDAAISSRAAAADYTAARAAKLDNLNATISSRASATDYTAARAALLDNLDALVSSRASATDYTAARAAKLDNLNATISSRPSGTDYTTARAAKLDNLDASISSRQATLTFEKYYDAHMAAGATYTPAAKGLFMANDYASSAYTAGETKTNHRWDTYFQSAWHPTYNYNDGQGMRPLLVIGDGANLKFVIDTYPADVVLMRMG
jgi:hypothetical protein